MIDRWTITAHDEERVISIFKQGDDYFMGLSWDGGVSWSSMVEIGDFEKASIWASQLIDMLNCEKRMTH